MIVQTKDRRSQHRAAKACRCRSLFQIALACLLSSPAAYTSFKVVAGDEWKAVDMSRTTIVPGSALDFSALVEDGPAGKYGRVIVGRDGQFTFEKRPQTPVRFFPIHPMCRSALSMKKM
ncbi:MAG: hypothetical protein AABZ39_17320 [Spirochaetota bacterium]